MNIDHDEFIRRYTKNKPVEIEDDIAVFVAHIALSLITTFCFYMGAMNLWICAGVFFAMMVILGTICSKGTRK